MISFWCLVTDLLIFAESCGGTPIAAKAFESGTKAYCDGRKEIELIAKLSKAILLAELAIHHDLGVILCGEFPQGTDLKRMDCMGI